MPRVALPPKHDHIHVLRVQFDQFTPGVLNSRRQSGSCPGRQKGRARCRRVGWNCGWPARPAPPASWSGASRFSAAFDAPDIPLVAVTAPVAVLSLRPTIKDRFVLALVVGTAQRKGVLGPDDEGGPLATRCTERLLQGMQFAGGHGDIGGAGAVLQHWGQRSQQKIVETVAQVVVQGRAIVSKPKPENKVSPDVSRGATPIRTSSMMVCLSLSYFDYRLPTTLQIKIRP
jgi:hypothetical protein